MFTNPTQSSSQRGEAREDGGGWQDCSDHHQDNDLYAL